MKAGPVTGTRRLDLSCHHDKVWSAEDPKELRRDCL
jgi:hypothetical protein